jgi:hypothetical protein
MVVSPGGLGTNKTVLAAETDSRGVEWSRDESPLRVPVIRNHYQATTSENIAKRRLYDSCSCYLYSV